MTATSRQQYRALLTMARQHDSLHHQPLLRAVIEQDAFGDPVAWVLTAYEEGIGCGLMQCDNCMQVVEDPAHPDSCDGCHILDDGSGIGDTVLCDECYQQAKAARAKIVVHEETDDEGEVIGTYADVSALTADEQRLARYLDAADEGRARQARDLIGMYPRAERPDLHRYQNQIDYDRALRGKQRA